MKPSHLILMLAVATLLSSSYASADALSIPHSFEANTPALAAEVNANFSVTATFVNNTAAAVSDNNDRIEQLEQALTALQGRVETLENTISAQASTIALLQGNSVLTLNGKLSLVTDTHTGQPTARFSGVNVQVVNGSNDTETTTGVGNLIVGYNEGSGSTAFCSDGAYQDETSCIGHGTWAANQRSGSHNLIVGNRNAYSQYGGLLASENNIVNGRYASVSGGTRNRASGLNSSVSGGQGSIAIGDFSSVSGGAGNEARGWSSSVSGGGTNEAIGWGSSVSGGWRNTADDEGSSVSGGYTNKANGLYSSVSGGDTNEAIGWASSVSGGWRNIAGGDASSVSGGGERDAPNDLNWAAGSLLEDD